MPYIKSKDRPEIDDAVVSVSNVIETVGELNYAICQLILNWLNNEGGVSYTRMNEVHGVLSCVDKEIYRRITAPYEDKKRDENGDVF